MKKALFSLLILFCISISHAQDFYEYKISPSLIVNGDSVELTFSAKDKIDFHKGFPKLDDLRYVGASRGQNIVNNYRESHITLTFVPRASGDITIPPIEVTLDGKIYKCKARTFKVWPSGANYPQDKIIMTRVLYNGKDTLPKTIYTGQAFVIDYEISVVGSWRYLAQNTFNDFRPKMKAPNLNLMVQAQDFNRNLYFKEIEGSRVIDGVPYRTTTYRYIMSPVKSGDYEYSLTQQVIAVQKNRRGLPRNNSKQLEFSKTEKVHISPVPAPPKDVHFLDLTGSWQVSATTSKKEVQTGHTFELIISVSGHGGDHSRLSAPELKFPGFEIDPRPDINFDQKPATIKYAMRALTPQAKIPEITFSTFDHLQEKFIRHPVNINLKVSGQDLTVQTTQNQIPSGNTPRPKKNVFNPQKYIPALITNTAPVRRPLLLNISPIWYILCPLLPLIFVALYLWTLRNPQKKNMGINRAALLKKIKAVCHKINTSEDQSLVDCELVPLLAEYNGLAQGTTAIELAKKIEDKELAQLLEQVSNDNYLPHSVVCSNLKQLTATLTKTLTAFLLFLPFTSKGDNHNPYELYKSGEYLEASQTYEKFLKEDSDDAALYANLAHCYFMLKKYPQALAHYETASRLAPANQEISNSLNITLKTMKISREQSLFFIVNRLRPDQWLKVAFATWLAFWFLLIVQVLRKAQGKRWIALWGSLLTALCLIAYFYQNTQRYQENQAIVKADSPIYKSTDNQSSQKMIPKGAIIQLGPSQDRFYQINFNDETLWIKQQDVIPFW